MYMLPSLNIPSKKDVKINLTLSFGCNVKIPSIVKAYCSWGPNKQSVPSVFNMHGSTTAP